MRWVVRAAAAGAALAVSASGAAQMVPDDDRATWTLAFENDSFFGSDDNYTSGLRLSYLSGNKPLEGLSEALAKNVLRLGGEDGEIRTRRGFALMQEIYTPTDLKTARYLTDQQPYAGYLYGRFSRLFEQANRVDQLSLEIGVVGPSALGQEAQEFIHNIVGREDALGWDNQIDDTLGLNIAYERQRRLFHSSFDGGFGWDCVPYAGASFGTVKTAAHAGFTVRIGENLSNGYGPPRVRPSMAGSGFFVPQDRRSWYLFAGSQVEATAHSIFLDGSLFRDDDPSVEKKVLTADLQTGAAVQLGGAQLAFTYVFRTQEFRTQEEAQRFGALSISKRF